MTLTHEDRKALAEVTMHVRVAVGDHVLMLTEEQARDVLRTLGRIFALPDVAIERLEGVEGMMCSLWDDVIRIEADTERLGDQYAAMGEAYQGMAADIDALASGPSASEEPPAAPPQSGAPYSEEEIERIRALLARGKKPKFIGAAIGRSEASVYQKINGTPALFALYNPEKAAKEQEYRDMLGPDAAADGGK